jgi:hypothetical protein
LVKKVLNGEKEKNKKYANTKGIKMCCNSFNVIKIAIMPKKLIKNFTAESTSTLFI